MHILPSFCSPAARVYVKREDESGFGISGCKKRKYASLLPFLLKHHIQTAVLLGGAHSNHVVGITQLLHEHRIGVHAFLKKPHASFPLSGNALLRNMLLAEEQISWVPADAWGGAEALAAEYARNLGPQAFFIPEGGTCPPALPGACTLLLDIQRQEQQLGTGFDHIWIDAGTGLMAAALIGMNTLLERHSQVHVVLVAGDEAYFHLQLKRVWKWFEEELQLSLPPAHNFELYPPVTARAFGSVNAEVRRFCLQTAREEGLLLDPIYTAKLFLTARHSLAAGRQQGHVLLIHSGGGTGLMGFGRHFTAPAPGARL